MAIKIKLQEAKTEYLEIQISSVATATQLRETKICCREINQRSTAATMQLLATTTPLMEMKIALLVTQTTSMERKTKFWEIRTP